MKSFYLELAVTTFRVVAQLKIAPAFMPENIFPENSSGL